MDRRRQLVTKSDVFLLIGLGLLAAGFYFVYPPLALILPGAFFVGMGVLGALSGRGG